MAKRHTKSKDTDTGADIERTVTPPAADGERIITTRELLERIPLDRSTIWRMVREKRFPPPIQLTASRIGWRWSAVAAWLKERERHRIPQRRYFGRDVDTGAA